MNQRTEPDDVASVETDDNVHSVRRGRSGVDIVARWVGREKQPNERFLLLFSGRERM